MRLESWIRPAGVSPVRVIAGVPGSRPQSRGEIPAAERGVESLLEGASARAATAASSESQSGSRAAHVTAKAMPVSPGSGSGLGGSLRGKGSCTRARSDHGTRETRLSSLVSKDRSYKPVVKSGGGQRESEGAVVVRIGVQKNASGAKGPHFGRGRKRGTRKGMAGMTGPNHPGERGSPRRLRAKWPLRPLGAVVRNDSGASYGQPPSGRRVRASMPSSLVVVTRCGWRLTCVSSAMALRRQEDRR